MSDNIKSEIDIITLILITGTLILNTASLILMVIQEKQQKKRDRMANYYAGRIPGKDGKYYCHQIEHVTDISLHESGRLLINWRPFFCQHIKDFCGNRCEQFYLADRTKAHFYCDFLQKSYTTEKQ